MVSRRARCNFDGRPISPGDQVIIGKFLTWLALPREQQYAPEWHGFLGCPGCPACATVTSKEETDGV